MLNSAPDDRERKELGCAGIAVGPLVVIGKCGKKAGFRTVAERMQLAAGAHAAVASEAVLVTGLVGG